MSYDLDRNELIFLENDSYESYYSFELCTETGVVEVFHLLPVQCGMFFSFLKHLMPCMIRNSFSVPFTSSGSCGHTE